MKPLKRYVVASVGVGPNGPIYATDRGGALTRAEEMVRECALWEGCTRVLGPWDPERENWEPGVDVYL